jgi:multisubunit Na+/H+ antiporter MnhE subunit
MPNRVLRMVGELVGWWVLLFLLYLVLISTLSPLELVVGAAASGLSAVAAWAIHRAVRPEVGPVGHWTAALWALPGTLLRETVQLACLTRAALRGRPAQGRFATVRLRPGVGAAWACALLSGTPGSCVLDVDEQPGAATVLRVHSLFGPRSRLETVLTEADQP